MVALQGLQNHLMVALQRPKYAQKGLLFDFFTRPRRHRFRPIFHFYCIFLPPFLKMVALQRPQNRKLVFGINALSICYVLN